MYLITPTIVTLICGLTRGGLTYGFPEMVSKLNRRFIHSTHWAFLYQVIFSYAIIQIALRVSFLISAHFEIPFCNLSKFVLQKKRSEEKIK
jgi:hypothetical protein